MRIWLKDKKRGLKSIIWSDTQVKVLLEEVARKSLRRNSRMNLRQKMSGESSTETDINYKEDNEKEMDKKANEVMYIESILLPFSIPMLDEMYKIKLKDIDDMDSGESKVLVK
ncbi:16744_t:CDS:2 [Funneliformis caledonium]|uniref:16744_t:CDS:1 n=1 Tax=Funneliformis caledonium TaxID=1117310 RepID=A0A9N9C2D6_9GLOM|nr:16744_t:CDS:2 [Funneliformis caledonium]